MSLYDDMCMSERQTESAKSYNCGSILQAQSLVLASLIQHTHCSLSRLMIPLCLTHTHTHTHTIYPYTYAHIPSTVHKLMHKNQHTHAFNSPHPHFTPALFLIYMCSHSTPSPFSVPSIPSLWSPEQLLIKTLEGTRRERGGSDRGVKQRQRDEKKRDVEKGEWKLPVTDCKSF